MDGDLTSPGAVTDGNGVTPTNKSTTKGVGEIPLNYNYGKRRHHHINYPKSLAIHRSIDGDANIVHDIDGIREMVLDTGCNTSLHHTDLNHMLTQRQPSSIQVSGFSGSHTTEGDKHGILHMYIIGSNADGSVLSCPVDTIKPLNHELFSLRELFENGRFNVTLYMTDSVDYTRQIQ